MDPNETNILQIDEDLASSLQELDIDELQGFAELHANHEDDPKLKFETEKWLATHLDEAIEEVGLTLQGEDSVDVNIVGALVYLEARLVERFKGRRGIQGLNRALKVAGIAIKASPNDGRRDGLLNRLSNHFALHFEYTKGGEDMNQAVELAEQAVIITPPGYDGRAVDLANFGNQLLGRFRNFGRREDLAHGHRVLSEALELTPTSDRFWCLIMGNLAISYGESFEHTKDKEDLNRAIGISLKPLPSFSNEDPVHAIAHINLAMFLRKRSFCNFELGDDMINMYHIIEACVKKTIPLKYRYTVEEIDDIERAVDLVTTAIGTIDHGSLMCDQIQHHLAAFIMHRCYMLLTRPKSSHDILSDLKHAIDLEEITLNTIHPDIPEHPDRACCWYNMGGLLNQRFRVTGDHGDYQRSVNFCRKAWKFRSENPRPRVGLASTLGARLSLLSGEEEAAADSLEEAVQLLPAACSRSISDTDKQAHLQQLYDLGSSAAAACLNAGRSPSHALEVLEAGRGVVASLLLYMRSDLSDLRQKHPDLAERFEMLGEMLTFKSNVGEDWRLPTEAEDSHPDSSQASSRIRLHKEFDELVQAIRNQVGFSKFPLPLSPCRANCHH